jgi:hypothetical protein
MTKIEIVREDEKATEILKAIRQIDDGKDLEPVVYCQDCARCKKSYCTIRKDSWGATLLVGQHDYCSNGERKPDAK